MPGSITPEPELVRLAWRGAGAPFQPMTAGPKAGRSEPARRRSELFGSLGRFRSAPSW